MLSFGVGLCGYIIQATLACKPPFYIEHAMYATLFIFIGEFLRRNTKLLIPNIYDKWNILISTILFVILIFTSSDSYEDKPNNIQYYFNGVIGTIAI